MNIIVLMVLTLIADGFYSWRLPGLFWFRIYGYGLAIKNSNRQPLIFSERMRISRSLKIGRYIITVLISNPVPNKINHGRK